ncbi:unnamed protein product [Linum tenue]|uniref:Cytochrome b561 domain-containing protein n=1 Tax=Linum tenue TaxID=586396 RepID=A0AAV0QM34_9ROSI|nr:unnamed protein product [Linum tenue]
MPLAFAYQVCLLPLLLLLPFVGGSSHDEVDHLHQIGQSSHKISRDGIHKLLVKDDKKTSDIALHGILLWVSMGVLSPLGILTIRLSLREQGSKRRVFFYLHIVFQALSVLLATSGAILSIISFENKFDNNHQRIGLALYGVVWLQAVLGFLRPRRGNKRRSTWYFAHWVLGTVISLVGIINVYTGLEAYKKKTSKGTRLWSIIFTAQVSFMAFFYLFQDKWDYMQNQGVMLGHNDHQDQEGAGGDSSNAQIGSQKALVPLQQPSRPKRNALQNLFE